MKTQFYFLVYRQGFGGVGGLFKAHKFKGDTPTKQRHRVRLNREKIEFKKIIKRLGKTKLNFCYEIRILL